MRDKKTSIRPPKHIKVALVILIGGPALLAIIILILYLCNFAKYPISGKIEQWGQTGDYFGGMINPVLGFASLLAVRYTLWLQFENSTATARFNAVQQLEVLIFELLQFHRQNLDSIDIWEEKTKHETRGRDCLGVFIKWIRHNHHKKYEEIPSQISLSESYRIFYEDYGRKDDLGHYFRNLYHIFKFIDESSILTDGEKFKYTKIVRAQISVPETALLFFNGLHPSGARFRQYINKYTLLQELQPSDIGIPGLTIQIMKSLYEDSAFVEAKHI